MKERPILLNAEMVRAVLDGSFIGAYAIWQREDDKWDVRWCRYGKWVEIASQHFDTENQAFNVAHAHYVEDEKNSYRMVPGKEPE